MKKVTVQRSGSFDLLVAGINGKPLAFKKNKAERSLTEGEDHGLVWFVRGAPGSKYTIAITAPDEAKFEHKGTLDASTKDGGLHWFRLNEEEE